MIFLIVIALAIILALIAAFAPVLKGKFGESLVALCLKINLDKNVYQVINNVMLPDDAGGTTQIDHIVLSPYGIFVIETKYWKGSVYGSGNDAKWTLKVGKKSFPVQNPFRQNYKHIKCLAAVVNLPEEYFVHTIVFSGDCKIKTREKLPVSLVTNPEELVKFIGSYKQPLLDDAALNAVRNAIGSNQVANTFSNHRKHVQHVNNIIENKSVTLPVADDFPEPPEPPEPPAVAGAQVPTCPKCGSPMVLRQATRGSKSGNSFWGCSRYPSCRGIINCE